MPDRRCVPLVRRRSCGGEVSRPTSTDASPPSIFPNTSNRRAIVLAADGCEVSQWRFLAGGIKRVKIPHRRPRKTSSLSGSIPASRSQRSVPSLAGPLASQRRIQKQHQGTFPAAVLPRGGRTHMCWSAKRGTMKRYYIAVCVPQAGGWRAIFPDAPGCEVEAPSLDRTVLQARFQLARHASSLNGHAHEILPPPRDLADIRSGQDEQWRAANAIDWPGAVITMIPLSV